MDSGRSEWSSVVRPNCIRETELSKDPSKGRLRPFRANRRKSFAEQEHPAVVIGDRQWVAVLPVSGLELALEVSWPDLIGSSRLEAQRSRVLPLLPTTILSELAVPIQDLVHGAAGG
jgi:hypothetical protein